MLIFCRIENFCSCSGTICWICIKKVNHTNDYNFSFSGLKTSVRYFLQKNYKTKDDNKIDLNNLKLKIKK